MASPVSGNSFQTFQAVGNREDLEDVIYTISPVETPFMTMAKRTTAKAVYHEWQTDSLASAAANILIEGDDAANGTSNPTVRMGNYCQISGKYAVVTDTQNAVDKAGRGNEMSYQIAKRLSELKRDMELALVTNQESTAGGAASARSSAGIESFLPNTPQRAATIGNSTDVGKTAEGTTPGFKTGGFKGPTDASVGGTFAVQQLKNVIGSCWANGGNPGVIMVNQLAKQKISGFAGIATLYREAGKTSAGTAIVGAADLYISDFGEHRVVPNRFVRGGSGLTSGWQVALILDMDYWSVAYLRKVQQKEIARTGASEKRFIDVEFCLVAQNPLASGKISGIDSSL